MRLAISILLGALIFAGCTQPGPTGSKNTGTAKASPTKGLLVESTNASGVIVTPGTATHGKIMLVNAASGYVVVSYPIGQLPAADSRLHVYRKGLKVGEIKVDGRQRDNNLIADVLTGECQVGDEVKKD